MDDNFKQTNTYAILSLVFAFLFSPLGLIFGFIALNKIKNNPDYNGKGLAIAGIILSSIFIIIPLILFIGAITYFGIINPVQIIPERTTFSAPFPTYEGAAINSEEKTISIVLTNNYGQKITIIEDGTCKGVPSKVKSSKIEVNNGEKFILTFPCEMGEIGSRFDGDLSFKYETPTGLERTHTGRVTAQIK